MGLLQEKFKGSISSKLCLIGSNQTLTFEELLERSSELAAFFDRSGAQVGDRIAIQLPNSIEFVLCYFAGIVGGYTIVPISSALPSIQIDYILGITKPSLLIKELGEVEFSEVDGKYAVRSIEDAIAAIFFTSGTTNYPKGVCHTVGSMFANAVAFNQLVGLGEETRMMHVMPMGYMAGFLNSLLCPLVAGGCVVLAPQFNAREALTFWRMAIEQNINSLWITPTIAAYLSRLSRDSTICNWTSKNLRHLFVGTAPLPKPVKDNFESAFGVECLESYGMTEVLLVASNTSKYPRKVGSVGRLLKDVEMKARDVEGNILPAGQAGVLHVRTPFALSGYLEPDTGTIISPLENGWLSTGDLGCVDESGDLFITGRAKDLIIHGGMNVSPRAVEEVLLQHPDVQDVAVIGKAHPFWGEEVAAFVVLKQGRRLDSSGVLEFCKNNLPPDAVPSILRVLDDLPRASTGKVQTHALKDL